MVTLAKRNSPPSRTPSPSQNRVKVPTLSPQTPEIAEALLAGLQDWSSHNPIVALTRSMSRLSSHQGDSSDDDFEASGTTSVDPTAVLKQLPGETTESNTPAATACLSPSLSHTPSASTEDHTVPEQNVLPSSRVPELLEDLFYTESPEPVTAATEYTVPSPTALSDYFPATPSPTGKLESDTEVESDCSEWEALWS